MLIWPARAAVRILGLCRARPSPCGDRLQQLFPDQFRDGCFCCCGKRFPGATLTARWVHLVIVSGVMAGSGGGRQRRDRLRCLWFWQRLMMQWLKLQRYLQGRRGDGFLTCRNPRQQQMQQDCQQDNPEGQARPTTRQVAEQGRFDGHHAHGRNNAIWRLNGC